MRACGVKAMIGQFIFGAISVVVFVFAATHFFLTEIPLKIRLEIIDPAVREQDLETVVEPGQPIYFRCIANGDHPMYIVSYSWLPLNFSDTGEEPVSIPVEPDKNDKYRYNSMKISSSTPTKRILMCEAKNAYGIANDRHIFSVNKPGSPPLGINVTVDIDNRVAIKFQPPKYPNGQIKKYNIYVSIDPTLPISDWYSFPVKEDLDDPKIVFSREELEPGTPHYVKAAAVNDNGEGIHSDPINFTTVSGAPIDPPSDIFAVISFENDVNVTWISPSQTLGPIKAYTVYLTVDDSSPNESYKSWQKIDVGPNYDGNGAVTLQKDYHNIKPDTTYKIRISATNDLSEGPASEAISFKTKRKEIPPTITLDPAFKLFYVEPNGTVIIKCLATGLPESRVWWEKEDGDIVEGNKIQLSEVIENTSLICMAENNAGKVQRTVKVKVIDINTIYSALDILPYYDLHMKWMKRNISRKNYRMMMNISLVSAFEYSDQIAIQISAYNFFARKIYCHYYDSMKQPLGIPFESRVFPESIVYCSRKARAKFVSLTSPSDDWHEYPIPLIDRTKSEPKHFFSVCMAPIYGNESKWLLIAEFMEYYKLQGATHFYIYIANISTYDRAMIDDYVRTGDAEVIVLHDRFERPEAKWQQIEIHNCVLRSRNHSKWVALVDIDERLSMTKFDGTISDYLRQINDTTIGSIQFRQRWIMKTELQPESYINEHETIKWMPTQRYLNASHVGPPEHTTKCIIRPETIGAMFVHTPYVLYPGYRQYALKPEEGFVRHYRDQQLGRWGELWLKKVRSFGSFEITKLDENLSQNLIKSVVKRVKYVYGKMQNGF